MLSPFTPHATQETWSLCLCHNVCVCVRRETPKRTDPISETHWSGPLYSGFSSGKLLASALHAFSSTRARRMPIPASAPRWSVRASGLSKLAWPQHNHGHMWPCHIKRLSQACFASTMKSHYVHTKCQRRDRRQWPQKKEGLVAFFQ